MRRHVLALLTAALIGSGAAPLAGAAESIQISVEHWSFQGIFGTFDRPALQRGFQVYKDVCSACHSMSLLHYRDLQDIGLSEDQVKQIGNAVPVRLAEALCRQVIA